MPHERVRDAVLALAIGAIPSASPAQVPASPEFVVNTYSYQEQRRPAVAMDGRGNFVVAWQSNFQDGGGYGVFVQRFDLAGVRIGGEFQANTSTAFHQFDPAVAADRNGDFVVVWSAQAWTFDIWGQGLAPEGLRRGRE